MDNQKVFYKIIDEICNEKNISQTFLSRDWIRELKKGDKIHHIIGYQFDLNSANSYNVAKDKYATYAILKENNIPMIEHKILFSPISRSNYFDPNYMEIVRDMLEKNDKIIIKANDSSQGDDVYCTLNEEKSAYYINKMFENRKDTLSICPYKEIEYEYRVIFLKGEILYIYKKKKPYVVGDGIHTLKELIDSKYGIKNELCLIENLDLNNVIENKKEVVVSWKHNLSKGAEICAVDENDIYLNQIKDIAIRAGNAIGISFASIDIGLTSEKEITVIEINGSVCMNKFADDFPNGYKIAKNIFSRALDEMFKE